MIIVVVTLISITYRHEKHLAFHRKYPEKFAPEGILEQTGGPSSPYHSLPVYFGNVCLRFLPVSFESSVSLINPYHTGQ
jgi:hypothetical protein